jgi:hypothetical protein
MVPRSRRAAGHRFAAIPLEFLRASGGAGVGPTFLWRAFLKSTLVFVPIA